MNCQSFENVVNDLTRGQMMEASTREQALQHASECAACSGRLAEERLLTTRLREFANAMKSAGGPLANEELLRSQFRAAMVQPVTRVDHHRRYLYAAAAAILLAVVSIATIRLSSNNPPDTMSAAQDPNREVPAMQKDNSEPSPKETPNVKGAEQKPDSAPRQRVKRVVPRRPQIPSLAETVASNTQAEITTEFLPIGYANPVSVQEGGQLVRVELPRQAMARFGLPVNVERLNERVKADVLISADGLAQAIRFVQ